MASIRGIGATVAFALLIFTDIPRLDAQSSFSASNVAGLRDFGVYATGTGCGAVQIAGSGYVDSFDSSKGTYAQTKQLSQGIVGTSGNIHLSGSATVDGPIFALNTTVGSCANGKPGITLSGKAKATGGYVQLNAAPAFPNPPAVTAGSQNYTINSSKTLGPGSYGNIAVVGGKTTTTLTLSPGTYNINSISFVDNSALTISPSGQVIINVAGKNAPLPINFIGGAISNSSGIPLNLQIVYGGSSPITMLGGAMSYAVLYAPNAQALFAGGAAWYGAIVVKTLDDLAGVAVHYDRSLAVLPAITAAVSPLPNATGWNNSNVSVAFTCSDSIFGVISCSLPVALAKEGANQTVTGTAVNTAGFSSTTSVAINIDKTPPLIAAAITPAPNAAGWNNSNPTVTFRCSDSLSGTASCNPPVTVATETAGQVITGTAMDKAGNTAAASVTVKLDKTPPVIAVASPGNGTTVYTSPVPVTGTVSDSLSGLSNLTCGGASSTVTAGTFDCGATLNSGVNSVLLKAVDIAGNVSSTPLSLTYAPTPKVSITSPADLSFLNLSPTTVSGTVSDPSAKVVINSISAPVDQTGHFSASVPLSEGPNILTASATSQAGGAGTATVTVTLDTTPPHVTITSPTNQFVTSSASISVAGNVNDIVVGTVNSQQATVKVNGIASQFANRTFLAQNVPLNMGTNTIQAVAVDRAGNSATTQITVLRQAPQPGQIQLVSGNNQTATIGSALAAPLVVALTDTSGNPAPNKPVLFSVTQNNGLLAVSNGTPAASVLATTNANGQATANWTLGMRSGAGSDGVQAYAVGFSGTAVFTASANQGTPGMIVVDTGNEQTGAVNQPLPKPFIAVVTDAGHNRLPNIPVTFTVVNGGGNFGGQPMLTVNTDSDGRAAATLNLGFQEGSANNLVTATFSGNTGFPASFTASGLAPGNPAATVISGLVLDNTNQPLPGVTIRALLSTTLYSNPSSAQTAAAVQTDATGHFSIYKAPVGYVKLFVDGSTATAAGTFPSLEYDMVTVAGQINTVGQPIFLLPLVTTNQLCVTDTTGGGTLTIPEAPGFSLTFGPGQVTFPGGTKTGCISVSVVHPDKVPMVPGFGQQPRFIVTIQPSSALFNAPAPITLPNVDGLQPREVTEMYSYDHDISSFVAIGTGTVSDDGQVIRSNPGVGVLKAGWHCGGNPYVVGTSAYCGQCAYCDGQNCQPNTMLTTCVSACVQGGVGFCQGGNCTGTPINCSSGNPCIDDGCDTFTGCTHSPNQLCTNACNGQTSGACNVVAFGTTYVGTCDANGNCNLCGSPGVTSCPCASGAPAGTCSSGQCQCQCAAGCVSDSCSTAQCNNGTCNRVFSSLAATLGPESFVSKIAIASGPFLLLGNEYRVPVNTNGCSLAGTYVEERVVLSGTCLEDVRGSLTYRPGGIISGLPPYYYDDKFDLLIPLVPLPCTSTADQTVVLVNPTDGSQYVLGQKHITKTGSFDAAGVYHVWTCVDGSCNDSP